VFEREAGEGAPTMTQICASDGDDESADEELELVTIAK